LLVAAVLTACTGPARTADAYRLKARHSAKAASSAVATARFAAQLVRDRGAFSSYLAVVLDSAERDADSVQATFASVQPPDVASDRLRTDLGNVLSDVVDAISSMRIAARRHEWSRVLGAADGLPDLDRKLHRFENLSA